VEGWIRRAWQGEAGPLGRVALRLLAPAELAWRGVTALRNRHWDRKGGERVGGIRVVSVGNLAVGGTGKTPVARWLVALLRARGALPAVVARGYGRDELLLHRRWHPDVPVVADADRVRGVATAQARGADVAVLDDGFQHRRLARDLDVVLLAAEDPLGGPLLPRGPFREPLRALRRADALVVTRRTASAEAAVERVDALRARFPQARVVRVALRPGGWATLEGAQADAPQGDVLVATAVARPEAVRAMVSAARGGGGVPELAPFPDHHDFTAADVRAIRRQAGSRTVVVTEKDAVKLEAHAELLGPSRVLTLELDWEEGDEPLRDLLTRATPENA